MNKILDVSELEEYLKKDSKFKKIFPMGEEFKLKILGHGEYNLNYVFTITNEKGRFKKYVLRQNIASQMHLDNQIEYEYKALELLEKTNRTPKVYYLNSNPDFLVMEFLEGRPLDYKKDLDIAYKILGDIHTLKIEENNHLLNPPNPLEAILEECEEMFSHYEKEYKFSNSNTKGKIRGLLNKGAKILKESKSYNGYRCIVNTELNSSNFLINGDGKNNYLIDWEKPIYGDPVQDLSHFLVPTTTFFKTDVILEKDVINRFLDNYIDYVKDKYDTGDLKERFDIYMCITTLRGITWSAMAYIEYMNPGRQLKNQYTFMKIKEYLKDDFLNYIEATYFNK